MHRKITENGDAARGSGKLPVHPVQRHFHVSEKADLDLRHVLSYVRRRCASSVSRALIKRTIASLYGVGVPVRRPNATTAPLM